MTYFVFEWSKEKEQRTLWCADIIASFRDFSDARRIADRLSKTNPDTVYAIKKGSKVIARMSVEKPKSESKVHTTKQTKRSKNGWMFIYIIPMTMALVVGVSVTQPDSFEDFYAGFFFTLIGLILAGYISNKLENDKRIDKIVEAEKIRKTIEEFAEKNRELDTEKLRLRATRQKLEANRREIESGIFESDEATMEFTNTLPLETRIQRTVTVGVLPDESSESYMVRRRKIIDRLERQWHEAERWGYDLLPFVVAQNGLCGDPTKDNTGKGCGIYLFSLPPTAVHLDHIIPRSKDGKNSKDNIQALCSYCNIKAGNKFSDSDPFQTAIPENEHFR